MGSERRIPAAECTEYPWWVIIDPDVIHGLFDRQQRVGRVAAAITGPFFSRTEAEAQLARRRYAYGPHTVVYSLSGHESADWRAFCHEPPGVQDATAHAEGEAAGAARERERVLALVRAAYDALKEASFVGWFGPSAASSALDVLEQHIEAGAHVAPAAGGVR